jgi:acetyl-CoA carboxylase biotin carboxylase subunit
VRWDGWIETGSVVPLEYDSLLGKVVVWAESRERAVQRMRRALDDLVIVGVPTSREFHQRVMRERAFCKGELDIGYWDRIGKDLMAQPVDDHALRAMAVAGALLEEEQRGLLRRGASDGGGAGAPQGGWLRVARHEGLR